MVHKLSCPGLLLKNIKAKHKILVSAKARKVGQIDLARTASIVIKLWKRFSVFDLKFNFQDKCSNKFLQILMAYDKELFFYY